MSINKRMTRSIKVMAELYCYCWKFIRWRLPERKDDFDYFVYDLREQYPTPVLATIALAKSKFFEKKVILNNDFEKTTSIKIGDVCIRYSFDKTIKQSNYIEPEPNWQVATTLYRLLRQAHHNASVINLNDERKKQEKLWTKKKQS